MVFVADENFPLPSVRALRRLGHDVLSIQESFSGLSDREVLRLAVREQRILLTFDRDFGERIFKLHESAPPGVVLLRFRPSGPLEPAELLAPVLNSATLLGQFTVVTRQELRQRTLPRSQG